MKEDLKHYQMDTRSTQKDLETKEINFLEVDLCFLENVVGQYKPLSKSITILEPYDLWV